MFTLHTIGLLSGGKQPAFGDRLLMGIANAVATPASANAITVLGAITAGTGFTNISTVTLAPSGGTGTGLKAVATSLKAVSATVVNGGTSGYANSDTITLANGVVLTVASVSSGVVATVTVSTAGAFTGQVATNPVAQASTSGSGVGTPTFNLAYGLGSAAITDSGSYTGAPSMTVTDTAAGTGASIATATLGGNGNAIFKQVSFQAPTPYNVLVEPGIDCRHYVPAALKTNTGFTVALVPTTAGTTLAAGTFDATLIA
ncbi:hypothetical protein [Limnoglobus roseus]|uniref:Uncharacterized protein n=1 Tax=Limnoglobus roseus TaxID=2598579 RepID=A0A5C1A9R6_9BACT|nr:hypothetical protein [Limnoglobus roseus]QEL14776.1 hypothetical protein PX52LOC_01670 [Limnoglobus roseus]